jgi:peptidoglycan-associated lipoprotein
MKRSIAAAAIVTAFAGCASSPPAEQTASTASLPPASPPVAKAPRSPANAGPAASATSGGNALGTAVPAQRSVYFDYDSNIVKEEFTPVVQSNARYVSQHRATRVTIQGNTDERGSREYNLALGQRRADAVKQRMTLLGVPAQQIETVSFGEEKPRADAGIEQAFAQNRRADIVYGK